MTELRLGLRLALAGGWTRALLVVIGNAVGVVVLLLATAVPTTLPQDLSPDDRRLAASLVLFLVLPVASLLPARADCRPLYGSDGSLPSACSGSPPAAPG